MMEILGMINPMKQILDTPLGRKVVVGADFVFSDEFNKEVMMAIYLVEAEMNYQKIDIERLKPVNLLITSTGEIKLRMTDIGNYIQFCIIDYSKLSLIAKQNTRLCILIEELVHRYWNYDDEEKIKFIDLQILKRLEPAEEMEHIFNLASIPNELKCQSLVLTPEKFDYLF